MRKFIFCAVFSFLFCIILKLGNAWLFFAPVYFMLEMKNLSEDSMWEIPMGVLICAIILIFCREYEKILLRALILGSATIISLTTVRRLPLFFALAITSLFVSPINGVYIVAACLWCGVRSAFVKKTDISFISRSS